MIAAVVQNDLHIHQLVARKHAALQRFLDALLRRLDVFLRDRAADHIVLELVAFARVRLDLDLDVSVVSRTARLPNEFAFRVRMLPDGFAVRHLRLAHVRLHVELAHHAIHQDLKVQFAHAGDDRLSRIRVGVHLERRIFLRQLVQRDAHLLLVRLRLRLDRHRDDRLRELDVLEQDRRLLIGQRIARRDVL